MRGEDARAHGYFRRAYDIAQTPRTTAQLGLVELALKQWLNSALHLEQALAAERDAWIKEQRGTLEGALDKARARIGSLIIEGTPAGAAVAIAGQPAGTVPFAKNPLVEPGTVTVELSAPGWKTERQAVRVGPGETATVRIHLSPVPETQAAPKTADPLAGDRGNQSQAEPRHAASESAIELPASVAPAGNWKRPVAWIAAGLTAVLAGAGTYFALRSTDRLNAFNDLKDPITREAKCGRNEPDAGGGTCAVLLEQGQNAKNLAVATFVGAGITATAAVLLLVTAPPSSDSTASAMACVPMVGAATGVGCGWRF